MEAPGTTAIPVQKQFISDQVSQSSSSLYGIPPFPSEEPPLEDINAFSTDPLTFEEMTADMLDIADQVFMESRYCNRFSTLYLLVCEELEKQIRRLGSACLTKAILEQKGASYPKLGRLSIELLYSMVSFNFRKCVAAYRTSREDNCHEPKLPQIISRWYALAGQLISTKSKIDSIRSGKINADALAEKLDIRISKANEVVPEHLKNKLPPKSLKKAPALPINRAMLRNEMKVTGARSFPIRKDLLRVDMAESGTDIFDDDGFPKAPEELFREMMIRETLRKQNHQLAERVKNASPEELRQVMEELPQSKGKVIKKNREGPSPEVRKKLREKRRKR